MKFWAMIGVLALAAGANPGAAADDNGNEPLTDLVHYSVGRRHTCAVATGGAAWCWGGNPEGQIGDGSYDDRFSPVPVIGLDSGVIEIAAGDRASCALIDGGTVKCWGSNTSRGLGLLTQPPSFFSPEPIDVPGVSGVRRIRGSSAGRSMCVVTQSNQVQCWGSPFNGPTTIIDVASGQPLANVVDIAVGAVGGCALIEGGTVKCWGNNSSGELGVDPESIGLRIQADTVPNLDAASVVAIGSGWFHRCAALSNGEVRCWGWNGLGQLGRGTETEREFTPAPVVGLPTVDASVNLAIGRTSSCAELSDGRLYCWGANSLGEFGNGVTGISNVAIPALEGRTEFSGVVVSMEHLCARDDGNALQCWGRSDNGQLGTTATTDVLLPTRIGTESSIDLAAGGQHTCSLTPQGNVRCWGDQSGGAVGNDTDILHLSPVDVVGLPGPQAEISSRAFALSCARDAAGAVRCWGSVLGTTPADPPLAFSLPATSVSVGFNHVCALLNNGSIECAGDNSSMQLGNAGAGGSTTTPVPVQNLPGTAVAVSAGIYHSCALLSTGQVACWGNNDAGQLGVDSATTPQTDIPQLQSAFSDVQEIGTGLYHTCAVRSGGSVWCWGGFNQLYGTLGDGTITDFTHVPVQVAGLPGPASGLSSWDYNNCVLVAGQGYCWGWNLHGPVGDGSSRTRKTATPTLLPGKTLVEIDTKNLHTCARTDANEVYCWGWNITAQIGNGEKSFSTSPEQVLIDRLARAVDDLSDSDSSGDADAESDPVASAGGEFVVYNASEVPITKGGAPGPLRLLRRHIGSGAVAPVSVDSGGSALAGDALEASVSANGQYIVFVAPKPVGKQAKIAGAWPKGGASSPFGVFLRNMLTGTTTAVTNASTTGAGTKPQISADGRTVVLTREADPGEGTAGTLNVFSVPLVPQGNGEFSPGTTQCQTCKVVLANGASSPTNSTGQNENPVVSADGQWLAFQTTSPDLLAAGTPCPTSSSQVMLRNLLTGATRSISAPASGGSCGTGTSATNPSMDFSGQNIVFVSTQPLAPNDNNGGSDVFLFKPTTGVAQISRGVQGSASSPVTNPVISGNGRIIAFTSGSTNLDTREPDNNDSGDVFVHRVRGGRLGILAKNRRGAQVAAASQRPSLPYTGGFLAFDSVAENVTDKPKGGQSSVYKRANALAADSLFDGGFE